MAGDRIQNHAQVAQNLVVPEPEDHPTLRPQPVVANSVVVILVVLFAIAFHDHSVGQAGEIDYEPSDGYLPPKVAFQLTPSQYPVGSGLSPQRSSPLAGSVRVCPIPLGATHRR
jgi:hypothetical protein